MNERKPTPLEIFGNSVESNLSFLKIFLAKLNFSYHHNIEVFIFSM